MNNCYIPPQTALIIANALDRVIGQSMTQDEIEAVIMASQLFHHLGRANLAEGRLPGDELDCHIAEVVKYGGRHE